MNEIKQIIYQELEEGKFRVITQDENFQNKNCFYSDELTDSEKQKVLDFFNVISNK